MSNGSAGAAESFRVALAIHRRGDLGQAERVYRAVLAQWPEYFDAVHMLGIVHYQKGEHAAALQLLDRAIAISPENTAAHCNRGLVLQALQRPADALASYARGLQHDPDNAETLNNRGNLLMQLRRPEEALASYDRALRTKPDHAQTHMHRGLALRALMRQGEALASYDRALQLRPDYAEALNNRGNTLRDLKRAEEALASYERALLLTPDYADAEMNRANVLRKLARPEEALSGYDRALGLKPENAEAFNNRGNALRDLRRPEEALASYDRALELRPDYADAHMNRGNLLQELKRADEALAGYDRALRLKPDYAEAHMNRGNALRELRRPEEALAAYGRALELKPDYAEAHLNRGNALRELKRLEEAVASYDRALQQKLDYAEAFNNRGNALRDLKRPDEALASYERALRLKPDYADALYNRGNVLQDLKRYGESAEALAALLAVAPDYDYALGYMFHARLHGCEWSDYEQIAARIRSGVERGERRDIPFAFLTHSEDAGSQLRCARVYVADKCPVAAKPLWTGQPYRHDRIRLAYLSADFHPHATTNLIAGLFEGHDLSRFELFAVSFGPHDDGPTRSRLLRAFPRFFDVRDRSDAEVAHLLRGQEIDIAVDLKGFTADSRTGIFAHRGAPLQVSYLGYPGTMGADYIDYIIADSHVIPAGQESFYSEKVVRVPDTYQVNDRKRPIAARTPSRAELSLPDSAFVFCCLNNNYKITPAVFDIWMRLLKRVDGSVLWLFQDNATASENLSREAERRGVAAHRLVFAPRMELDAHLARQRQADLFLDSFPYNAHTTASDALWAGLPLVTCMGDTFASRVAGSLLYAAGLPELVTHNLQNYEALAFELASRPEMLAEIKSKLAHNRPSCALFDTDRFRRHIEAAYTQMYQRLQRGEPPASFDVAAIAG